MESCDLGAAETCENFKTPIPGATRPLLSMAVPLPTALCTYIDARPYTLAPAENDRAPTKCHEILQLLLLYIVYDTEIN